MQFSKYSIGIFLGACALLAGCGVDTTGLSATSSRPARGSQAALVTVVEFADLQCPACKSAHEILNKPLLEKYGTRVRFEFMHFPLRTSHPYALEAAEAAECAADQNKFWEFVDMDYARQDQLNSSMLRTWAKDLGLDVDLFDRCVRSHIKRDTVMSDYAEGEKLGVNSTPSYFVAGVKVKNNIEEISAAIDAALQQASSIKL
jgi:protein-disulfide isomerase